MRLRRLLCLVAVAAACLPQQAAASMAGRGTVQNVASGSQSNSWSDAAFAAMDAAQHDCTSFTPSEHDGAADHSARARRRMQARRLVAAQAAATAGSAPQVAAAPASEAGPVAHDWPSVGPTAIGCASVAIIGLAFTLYSFQSRAPATRKTMQNPPKDITGNVFDDV